MRTAVFETNSSEKCLCGSYFVVCTLEYRRVKIRRNSNDDHICDFVIDVLANDFAKLTCGYE